VLDGRRVELTWRDGVLEGDVALHAAFLRLEGEPVELGPSGPCFTASAATWQAALVTLRTILGPELEVHGEEGLEGGPIGGDPEPGVVY
jgi:hypothetical protein